MPVMTERIVLKDKTCPVIRLNKARHGDKSVGYSISLGLHILIFVLVGISFVKPPQFGMEQGLGSIEVNLIGAKEEDEVVVQQQPVQTPVADVSTMEQSNDIQTPVMEQQLSRTVQDQSPVSMVSTGGAITEAKPDYLKNPAPAYPEAARRQKKQGTVIVMALIDKNGMPVKVDIEKSAGYSLLDQAALKAVKKWRFRPAMLGNMPIEASVRVPIRFEM